MPLTRLIIRSRKANPLKASQLMALVTVILLLLSISAFHFFKSSEPAVSEIDYTRLRAPDEIAAAASLSVDGELLTVTQKNGVLLQAVVTNEAAQQEIVSAFAKNNIPVKFRSLRPSIMKTAISMVLPLLTLLALGLVG